MRKQRAVAFLFYALFSLGMAGCNGGGGGDGFSEGDGTGGGGTDACSTLGVDSLTVTTSSPQVGSAASTAAEGVTITAFVKNAGNTLVPAAPVSFASTGGGLVVTGAATDVTGTATATLTTGGDKANQSITVSALSCGKRASVTLLETGTLLSVTGTQVVGSGTTTSFNVALTDSSGNPIPNESVSLASTLGNIVTPASAVTDSNGQAAFAYTGAIGGNDTLVGSAGTLNATANYPIAVANSALAFQSPSENVSIPFGASQSVKVVFVQGGVPVSGVAVGFATTRGTISPLTALTDGSGVATAQLTSDGSDGAGGVIVSANVQGGGPSTTLSAQFVAVSAASIAIQASPTTIAPSGQSTVTAVVRDAADNLVANQVVTFTLSDVTGGTLSAASGVTDSAGSVSIVYSAKAVTSAANGVRINASVQGTGVTTPSPALITVGGTALRISMGTGNQLLVKDETQYQLPYSVLVTDSAGNAVPGATFRLSLASVAYQKGSYAFTFQIDPATGLPTSAGSWTPIYTVGGGDPAFNSADAVPFGCRNEDVDLDGILDSGEDFNNNGKLDPGGIGSTPPDVPLDATGSGRFVVTFLKDRANWVSVRLTGIASVAGTETTATEEFILPVLAADVTNQNVSPPGAVSPYGQASSCASKN